MATPVSNYTSNFAVTPTEASRANGESTFKISFPDLLRGQMNNGANINNAPIFSPAQSAEARRDATSNEKSSRPPERSDEQEKPRQTSPERPPTPAVSRDPGHTQNIQLPGESAGTREARRTQGKAPDASASDPTSSATPAPSPDSATTPDTADAEAQAVAQAAAASDPTAAVLAALDTDPLAHDLPATIAALLAGIAADTPDEATDGESVADDDLDLLTDPHAKARTPRPSLPATTAAAPANTDSAELKPAAASALPTTSSSALAPATQPNAQAISSSTDPLAALAARGAAGAQTGAASPESPATLFNSLRSPTQATTTVPQYPVPTPAGQRAWAEEVGNRVMWMLGQAQSKAELVLTPPSLGKVEVSITLNGDQTTAQFVASSQASRDALEQALPRLRELLAQAGINLSHTDVGTSDGESQNEAHAAGRRGHHGGANGSTEDDETGASSASRVQHHDGLVNTFA
ncbi:flagellar protein [Betaproteobacteria bacterium]|nr:flagellar protein [Betaproteobacteria bacterium]